MADIPSVTPQAPLQPQRGTPTPPVSQHHKQLFIIGSLFTVLMLLTVSGILYFENYSVAIVQKTGERVDTTTQNSTEYKFYTSRIYTSEKGFSLVVPSDWTRYAVLEEPGEGSSTAKLTFALPLSSSTIEGNSKAAQAVHVFEVGILDVTPISKFTSYDDVCKSAWEKNDLCETFSEQDRNNTYVLGGYPKLHFYNYCEDAKGSEPYLCSVTQNVWGIKFATTTAQ